MNLYKIRNWQHYYENNRSRTVKDLAWVPIPNRHDGEHYSRLMTHKNAAEIFSCWILILQVASRCQPRGTLLRHDGKPHDSESLSMKTRAPLKWFEVAMPVLVQMLWLEQVASDCQEAVSLLTSSCQAGDEEGKEGNGKNGRESKEGVFENLTFKPPFDTEQFKVEFSSWLAYRLELKSPKGSWKDLFQGHLELLADYSVEDSIAALKLSRCNNWTGLFPKKSFKPAVFNASDLKLRKLPA